MQNILLLVMRRGLWQITCGLALGLAAAFPIAHLMASMPNGGLHSDPFVVALALASVGIFACWPPTRRASSLDPVRAIRYEQLFEVRQSTLRLAQAYALSKEHVSPPKKRLSSCSAGDNKPSHLSSTPCPAHYG